MFITKKSLSRRTLLKGFSATLALPLLDAMAPAACAAPIAPKRLGFVYFPNGAIMDQWIPKTAGAGFEFTPTLTPLEPYRDQLVVIGNLARAGTTIGDHAVAAAGWLTGVYAKKTEAEDVLTGPTIDQLIARQIGTETAFPSLEFATEDFTGYIGGCTPEGFSCTYMNTLFCWASPTTPVPMEINPRVAFERMVGRAGTSAQRQERQAEDRSILDSVAGDVARLKLRLGPRDKARLNDYLETIHELEQRIARAEKKSSQAVVAMDAPQGIPESFEEHAALMFDLQLVAYQADITRVVTFMLSREASQRTYPQIDVGEPHHTPSPHHGNDPVKKAQNAKINLYHAEQFAKFAGKMKATPDGDGTLLDHSLIFYGGGMGDGTCTRPIRCRWSRWARMVGSRPSSPPPKPQDAGGQSVAGSSRRSSA